MSNMPPHHPAGHLFGLAGLSVATLVVAGTLLGISLYAGLFPSSSQLSAVISATLVELANEDRAAEDLAPLTINPVLVAAAQAKADDMAAKEYFAHDSPEGLTSWYWFEEAGYEYVYAGENLAVNFSDSINVERAWMDSPGHRANIMSSKYTEIGIATAVGTYKGKRTTFVVQMFGTPRTVASAPVIEEGVAEPEVVAVVPEEEVEVVVEEPATNVLGAEVEPPPTAGPVEKLLVSPETILHIIYVVCAVIVLVALALTTRLEFKRHHTRHFAAASFLLAFIAGCLIIADVIVFGQLTLG